MANLNLQAIEKFWDDQILPTLQAYIKIPNKSPQFDQDWKTNGYMDQAVALASAWCKKHGVEGMELEVVQLDGRTPIIFIDIPGAKEDTVLLYGHLDKQPEMAGWDADLGPWNPVLKGDRLYGRGSADDGYAIFAALSAIKFLKKENIPHSRCIILIETCEESGSIDLPFYITALQKRIGSPSLIICLDSGCGNYKQLWATTSLRGLIGGTLTISVLKQGLHSGVASGIVPSPLRILRQLLNRIEDESTGDILLKDLYVKIPEARLSQAEKTATILREEFLRDVPFQPGVEAESSSIAELLLRGTWKPALSHTGFDGIPTIANAGNVTLPTIHAKLSMRIPPTLEPERASEILKTTLEKNPPYHAIVKFSLDQCSQGWNAPKEEPWLLKSVDEASQHYFGADAAYMGEGGTIPFMGMLGMKFPKAQFLITGVLGPGSNAHGPNEFLHLPTAKKLTACVAKVIADHARNS